ncbi:oligomeric, coiled-coil, peripheral membrane protein [Marasmius crinis-equi]|uniref:Autophagy-related protein 11 n=1 Tax=Marasmius crinis-equi TaxID=585013 RepID=A0ABR3FL27_9AGAR
MIRICRAEDGQIFDVKATLRDIERHPPQRAGSLEQFIQQESGIEAEAVLAYMTDGRRLTNANLRDFAGSADQSIFVFNKLYLEYDLEDVIRELTIEPPLQPPIEESIAATPPFRPTQLAASYLRAANTHLDHVKHIALTLHGQTEAIRIASNGLDMHILAVLDTYESLGTGLRYELQKQASLLAGLEADLDLIAKVRVHTDFVSATARKAIESGEKHRTLGDYVANDKMKQVAETCSRTHEDLQSRFHAVEQKISQLRESSDMVRATVSSTKMLEDSDGHVRRSHEIVENIANAAGALENPKADSEHLLQDLKLLDANLREELQLLSNLKNANTRQCMATLRHITVINNDLIHIPPELTTLQASFKGKNSFSHIQRLHNMIYAYGATVIEIVRRKEFSQFFYHRAQSILEVMAKLSSSERKRRQVYRSEIHGQLPFETKGMDDSVPTIDFSPVGGNHDQTYTIEREDVNGLFRVLDDLEQASRSHNDPSALSAVRECRLGLEKLVAKMDGLESGFDKIAERSPIEAEEQMYKEVVEQLRMVQDSKAQQETLFQEERTGLRGEIHRLQSDVQSLDADATSERERADRLERELHQVRAQLESEGNARRIREERNAELLDDLEQQRTQLAQALVDVTEQARVSDSLRQELAQVKHEFEDVKALEARNSEKVVNLLAEQANNLRNLEEARARGEDLEEQIRSVRAESDGVNYALREASEEKDRLLRAQASEHDRVLRDHIAEADGDRAVLERQFFECKAAQEHAERQLKELKSELEIERADAVGLREELQRVEVELREVRHIERVLRDDLKAGRSSQSNFENQLENSNRLLAQILDAAIAFRASHLKALRTAQTITSHPTSRQSGSASILVEPASAFSPELRHSIIGHPEVEEPLPIDPSDPAGALEALRAFDHDHFQEAIAKTGSTVRKWQKQCKEYRERAKSKISFRNFAKGDLALFLPTRNSVSKPWAAFNVSFPHYFLQATGHLAEQLRTREWIVARITSMTERIVDRNDPSSNPYGLGDGVKYYMLEVEDWTKPSHSSNNKPRKVSSRKPATSSEAEEEKEKEKEKSLSTTNPTLASSSPSLPPPPEAEGEESYFEVTHPPNSHLFPSRTRTRARSNSTPPARPSSLSRLLAQADGESPEPSAPIPVPATASTSAPVPHAPVAVASHGSPLSLKGIAASPLTNPSDLEPTTPPVHQESVPQPFTPLSSHSQITTSSPLAPGPLSSSPTPLQHVSTIPMPGSIGGVTGSVTQPSPLRPGSRASRLSTTSGSTATPKFRLPVGSSPAKAAATTALAITASSSSSSSHAQETSTSAQSPSTEEGQTANVTPSPDGSISEGITNLLRSSSNRRTSSYHAPRKSPLVPTESSGANAPHTKRNSSYNPSSSTASTSTTNRSATGMLSSFGFTSSSWGVPFGRRKKAEATTTATVAEASGEEEGGQSEGQGGAFASSSAAKQLSKHL